MEEEPKVYRIRQRLLKQPRSDKGDQIRYALRRARKQKKVWPEPEDAYLILDLHFSVKTFEMRSFHAEATLEIPVDEGFQYYTVSRTSSTEAHALRAVISIIETSNWFQYMKSRKVYFRITGAGMEELYRGYL